MDTDVDWYALGVPGYGPPAGGGLAAAQHLFPTTTSTGFVEDPQAGLDTMGTSLHVPAFDGACVGTVYDTSDDAACSHGASTAAGSGAGVDALAPGPGTVSSPSPAAGPATSAAAMAASSTCSSSTSTGGVSPSAGAPAAATTTTTPSSSTSTSSVPSGQLQPFEDAILEYMFRRAVQRYDPFTARGIQWPAGVTERRQFMRTHFASIAAELVYLGLDPASHRFLDYQRTERFEAFLQGAFLALGPAPMPDAMCGHVAAHAPEEIRRLLRRTVPADEFALVDPLEQQPRAFAIRMRTCACLADKLAPGVELLVDWLDGLGATLDDLYDGLERHLLLNPASLLMPRGVEPLLVLRYTQPRPGMPVTELLLARVPGTPRPYRWRASLSPGTMGIAQHLFDPSQEGVGTRLRDLGVFLPTTEVHACLWDGYTHGPAKRYAHSSSQCFVLERGSLPVLGPTILSLPIGRPLEALNLVAKEQQQQQQQPRPRPSSSCPFALEDKATGSMARSLTSEELERASQEDDPQASAGSGDGCGKERRGGPAPDAAGGRGPRCVECGGPARFKRAGGNKFHDGFCGQHADATMVDIRGPVCDYPDCTRPGAPVAKRATYALPGELKPRRCSRHREDGMVDVVHKAQFEQQEEGLVQLPPTKRVRGKARRAVASPPDVGREVSLASLGTLASGSASCSSTSLSSSVPGESEGAEGGGCKAGSGRRKRKATGTTQHRAKSSSLGSTASLLAATLTVGAGSEGGEQQDAAGLASVLAQGDAAARCTALQALGQMGSVDARAMLLEALEGLLGAAEAAVRCAALDAAMKLAAFALAPDGCLESMARLMLEDASLEVRVRALSGFLGIGDRARPFVATVARMLLEDPEPFARSVALDTLCCLGELALPYMDCVVAVLRVDPERLVVSRAVYHLSTGVFRDQLPALASQIAAAMVEVMRDDRVDQSQMEMANSLLAFCMHALTEAGAGGGNKVLLQVDGAGAEAAIPSSEHW